MLFSMEMSRGFDPETVFLASRLNKRIVTFMETLIGKNGHHHIWVNFYRGEQRLQQYSNLPPNSKWAFLSLYKRGKINIGRRKVKFAVSPSAIVHGSIN